jgi:hypothetical protein
VNFAIDPERYQLCAVDTSSLDSERPTDGSTYRRSRSARVCRVYLKCQIVAIHEGACLGNERYDKLANKTYRQQECCSKSAFHLYAEINQYLFEWTRVHASLLSSYFATVIRDGSPDIRAVKTLILCTLLDREVSYRRLMSPNAIRRN